MEKDAVLTGTTQSSEKKTDTQNTTDNKNKTNTENRMKNVVNSGNRVKQEDLSSLKAAEVDSGSRSHEMNSFIGRIIRLEPKKKHICKTAAFISNKGGVGKTHTSTNTAFYMSRIGKEVLVIDLDLGNSDVANKLGFYCEHTITDLLNGKRSLDHLIYQTPYGFHLIAGESGNLRLANLNTPQKRRFINALKEVGNDYDFVFYDLSAGIRATTMDFALAQDYQIVVTTPQDIVAGYACIKALYHRFIEVETKMAERDKSYKMRTTLRPFVVINQSPDFDTGRTLFEKVVNVSKQNIVTDKRFHLDLNLLGVVIGDQEKIRDAELNHYLYSGKFGASKTGQCYHFLAHNMTQYRDPNNIEFTTKLKRFANLFVKSIEETKFAQ